MLRQAFGDFTNVLATSHAVGVKADVWLAGQLLAERIPVTSASLSETSDQQVPESVDLTLASMGPDGTSYTPTGRGSASVIGSDGHRLRLTYEINRGNGELLTCSLGWYRITSWTLTEGAIQLTATGLLQVIADYQLLAATSPATGATLKSEIIRLVEGLLPVNVTASANRSASTSMAWTSDRLGALYDLADAWPADLRVDSSGLLQVTDIPTTWTADLVLIEGQGGTVVGADDGGSRDGISNVVVAQGEDDGTGTPVSAIARDTNPSSPTYIGSFDPVVSFFSSPLLTTITAATAAASTQLAKSLLQASAIPVTCLPDPRITFGTSIELHRMDGRIQQTTVSALTLPLTIDGGAQSLTLAAAS